MCIEVSGVSLMSLLKCFEVLSLIVHYMDIYVPFVLVVLPGKSDIIYRSMWSTKNSLCQRHNSTLEPTTVHINFEVAMYTVLKNAQCTFKNG